LVFLYKHVLDMEINGKIDAERAKRPKRLPVVLSAEEVEGLMANLQGAYRLKAGLLLQPADKLRLSPPCCVAPSSKVLTYDSYAALFEFGRALPDRLMLVSPQAAGQDFG